MIPIRGWQGHVLWAERTRPWAIYRLTPPTTSWGTVADQIAAMRELANLIGAAATDLTILRVTRGHPRRAYMDRARVSLSAEHSQPARWEEHLQAHAAAMAAGWSVEVYLAAAIVVADRQVSIGRGLVDITDGIRARLGRGRNSAPLTESEVAAEAALADRLEVAAPSLEMRPATASEIQWMVLRAACRGLGEPIVDHHWQPMGEDLLTAHDEQVAAGEEPLARLSDFVITQHSRALEFETELGVSHQAVLALGGLPEEVHFPGAAAEALHHPLAALGIPVDAVLHLEWIAPEEALRRVRRRVVDAHHGLAEEAQSEIGASWDAHDAPRRARELEQQLTSGRRTPLVRMSASLAVGADSPEELEDRVRALTDAYAGIDIVLRRPAGIQDRLWCEHLPGVGRRVADYAATMPVERVAALMPHAVDAVGSHAGPYIGRVTQSGGPPVLFDSAEAARQGRPPSALLWGTLGSGKTMAAQLIATQAALRGAVVCDLDPKPDHRLEHLPELRGMVRTIELPASDEYAGALDPLVIAPASEAEDLAASYLAGLLPARQAEAHATVIRRAVADVARGANPSCTKVLAALADSDDPEAQRAGADLSVWAESGLGRLGFAQDHSSVDQDKRPVTTVRAQGLVLPDPGVARADYSEAERISAATLTLLAAYAMRAVASDPSRHTVVLFDEAWFLLTTPAGRNLIARLNRMGRSMNASLLLVTQQLGEVGEIEGLVGTRLVFGQETHAEATRALELLGLDSKDPTLIGAVRQMRRGTCLMRDVHDRVAQVQIDPQPARLLDLLDTTPPVAEPSPGPRPAAEPAASETLRTPRVQDHSAGDGAGEDSLAAAPSGPDDRKTAREASRPPTPEAPPPGREGDDW